MISRFVNVPQQRLIPNLALQRLIPSLLFQTWQRSHSLRIHNGAVTALEIMGKVLVTSCFDKMIRCFDLEVKLPLINHHNYYGFNYVLYIQRLELLQVYSEHDDMIFSLATKNGAVG